MACHQISSSPTAGSLAIMVPATPPADVSGSRGVHECRLPVQHPPAPPAGRLPAATTGVLPRVSWLTQCDELTAAVTRCPLLIWCCRRLPDPQREVQAERRCHGTGQLLRRPGKARRHQAVRRHRHLRLRVARHAVVALCFPWHPEPHRDVPPGQRQHGCGGHAVQLPGPAQAGLQPQLHLLLVAVGVGRLHCGLRR